MTVRTDENALEVEFAEIQKLYLNGDLEAEVYYAKLYEMHKMRQPDDYISYEVFIRFLFKHFHKIEDPQLLDRIVKSLTKP